MSDEHQLFQSIGKDIDETVHSHLFGKPCFKTKGKAFICFYQNEMVFKLKGESHQKALELQGAHLFDPSGKNRPMKEWVQVPSAHKETWNELAINALQYVSSIK